MGGLLLSNENIVKAENGNLASNCFALNLRVKIGWISMGKRGRGVNISE